MVGESSSVEKIARSLMRLGFSRQPQSHVWLLVALGGFVGLGVFVLQGDTVGQVWGGVLGALTLIAAAAQHIVNRQPTPNAEDRTSE